MNNIFRKIVNYLFKMYTELQNFGPPTNNMNDSNVDSDISGVWYKTHPQFNGPDVLHVRDAIMDGNDMIVITDHGNMSMGEFANNYFKQSDKEYDLEGNEIINTATKPKLPLDSIPKPASIPKPNLPINNTSNIDYDVLVEGLEGSPMDIINPSSYNKVEVPDNSAVLGITTKNDTNDAIYKVFSKLNDVPQLNVSINWNNFPKTEIDMLMKYFDVSLSEIARHKAGIIYNEVPTLIGDIDGDALDVIVEVSRRKNSKVTRIGTYHNLVNNPNGLNFEYKTYHNLFIPK